LCIADGGIKQQQLEELQQKLKQQQQELAAREAALKAKEREAAKAAKEAAKQQQKSKGDKPNKAAAAAAAAGDGAASEWSVVPGCQAPIYAAVNGVYAAWMRGYCVGVHAHSHQRCTCIARV
jgi:predicted component of type VI protein secretion system